MIFRTWNVVLGCIYLRLLYWCPKIRQKLVPCPQNAFWPSFSMPHTIFLPLNGSKSWFSGRGMWFCVVFYLHLLYACPKIRQKLVPCPQSAFWPSFSMPHTIFLPVNGS